MGHDAESSETAKGTLGGMQRPKKTPRNRGLSTGQVARFCLVTSDTIVNWIKAELIVAQRTAGGQYRILASDLRTFMKSQGMSTDLLDRKLKIRPQCWEFHRQPQRGRELREACVSCTVKFLGVLHCFKFVGMRPGPQRLFQSCEQCTYFRRWGGADGDNSGADRPRSEELT